MGAISDNGQGEKTAFYVQALRLVQDGQVLQARSRVGGATAAGSPEPATSADTSERLAAALVEVITEVPSYGADSRRTAAEAIRLAQQLGRPAWAAAARAVDACGLLAMGEHGEALDCLVTAEAELAAERARPGPLDPFGSPSGLAAAANNLGTAYALLQFYELAEPHLATALRISADTYGPEIESQVSIDLYNLASLDLFWSLELLHAGDVPGAERRARNAVGHAIRLRTRATEDDHWPAAANAAASLELCARSVVDPSAVAGADADAAATLASPQRPIGVELAAMAHLAAARMGRLTGRPEQAAQAAAAIDALGDPRTDAVLWLARFEAALAAPGLPPVAADLLHQSARSRQRARLTCQESLAQRIRLAIAPAVARQG